MISTKRAPAALAETPQALMRSIIQRIATGPALSKDISAHEARRAMSAILDSRVDPIQAAVFLIALRMKRETDDENLGVLDAIRDATHTVTAPVEEVLDIADPYDGFVRCLPVSPFLPAVLAACGVCSVAHGVHSVGPKHGITHHRVLKAAGVPVGESPPQAAARLAAPGIGWAYLDQRVVCPKLNALEALRDLIVKRPVITTVEVLAGPVRGRVKTHLMTGYVHKAYPRLYALLARHAGFESALLVRGTEGGVVPSLRQTGKAWGYHGGGAERAIEFDPVALGIEQQYRSVPLPESPRADDGSAPEMDVEAMAAAAAEAGQGALHDEPGPAHDSLVYAAALVLRHLGREQSLPAAAATVREAIACGRAQAHFQAGKAG